MSTELMPPRPIVKRTYGRVKRAYPDSEDLTLTLPRPQKKVSVYNNENEHHELPISNDKYSRLEVPRMSSQPLIQKPFNNTYNIASSSHNQNIDNFVVKSKSGPQTGQLTIFEFFTPSPSHCCSSTLEHHNLPSPEISSSTERCRMQKNLIPRFYSSISSPKIQSKQIDEPPKVEQLFLDFGQKGLGPYTCPECKMSYNRGHIEDEAIHHKHHKAIIAGIDYPGYKNQLVVAEIPDDNSKIIVISGRSSSREQKKLREILMVINAELGSVELSDYMLENCKAFIYVSSKRKVLGCVIAESISRAYKVVCLDKKNFKYDDNHIQLKDNDGDKTSAIFYSTTPVKAVCGISRIWVSQRYRRKGIGSRLLDCVRVNFIFGCKMKHAELAFSQPTTEGKQLAVAYTKTANFLVYNELECN